ncbi:Protein VAC14-like [Oopsacas minuta]|uniref:Protein VAC14 homolog n=1 Tax=Oopsacas minuta TaxID=111878 RepID=A0AAV7K6B2_9METZ|nr:Protein VAC14-like [Oopsacas minuta]
MCADTSLDHAKDMGPFTPTLIKSLSDKLYDKRKTSALEIEKVVRDLVNMNEMKQVSKIVNILQQELVESSNPNSRKGGLIGMAASAIALGKENLGIYLPELVPPVLACFNDQDTRVRYYACEALYNITKVARASVLIFFCPIFERLCQLAADPDLTVRNGADLLDRLVKDIVTDSAHFDLLTFIPILREKLYTKDPHARQFLVSWMKMLLSVPEIELVDHLPELLDGLFVILDGENPEIRISCEEVLYELLREVRARTKICKTGSTTFQPVCYKQMVNVLVAHSQSEDKQVCFIALHWLKEFLELASRELLSLTSNMLLAFLPCVSLDNHKEVKAEAQAANNLLMGLILETDDNKEAKPLEFMLNECIKPGWIQSMRESLDSSLSRSTGVQVMPFINSALTSELDTQADTTPKSKSLPVMLINHQHQDTSTPESPQSLDLTPLVNVLASFILYRKNETQIASLHWIQWLIAQTPHKLYHEIHTLFPVLLEALSDVNDKVIKLALEVIAELSKSAAGLQIERITFEQGRSIIPKTVPRCSDDSLTAAFSLFTAETISFFKQNQAILYNKGAFIIREISLLVSPVSFYRSLASILLQDEELFFISTMVDALSLILLTSSELFPLRAELRNKEMDSSNKLFILLYRCWSHNPVAALALCFLTEHYPLAKKLVHHMGELEITATLLSQIDKLVQMLESPVFAYLRIQLLEPWKFTDLVESLYGILMILPQTTAFSTLESRLNCIPPHIHSYIMLSGQSQQQLLPKWQLPHKKSKTPELSESYDELFDYFKSIQGKFKLATETKGRMRH